MEKLKPFLIISALGIISTITLWLPFALHLESFWGIKIPPNGMATIVANFDGPYYIVVAKTLYDPQTIEKDFLFPLDPIYYSAHYPLFPLLIRATATILPFLKYPYSMIIVTILTSALSSFMFYLILKKIGLDKNALWLTLIFQILPARWLITRSVGSPEPLFIFTVLSSVYFFLGRRWWLAAIFGSLAQLTKPPGILLFASFVVAILALEWPKLAKLNFNQWIRTFPWKTYPIFLIPLTLIGLYIFYGIRYGDFFAYFKSGNNIHLMFPPFQVFNPAQTWVGTFWLEEIIWIYLLGALALVFLLKQKQTVLASFVGVFFLSLLFVAHRDIARYSLPIFPFALISFNKILTTKEFKWILLLLVVPIYLFSLAFISNNTTPISDWGPLL